MDNILQEVRSICGREAFQQEIIGLLHQMCAIDTSPAQDLARLRDNEHRVFRILRSALEGLSFAGGSVVWQEISPAVQNHPAFSQPYYAAGPVEEIYRGRGNLLFLLDRAPSAAGISTALNAHIDTVAPHFPPARSGDCVTGRGSPDDKGNVAVIVGALQVLAELERRKAVSLKNSLTAMFAIDEETGGNGSLDLALDRRLKERYDSILVLECTANQLHPANRGAVFIRCDARLTDCELRITDCGLRRGQATPSLLEAYALATLELLDEGEMIRQESDHPLFPDRPVQTCTGILGPFGKHPSAICGQVSFELKGLTAERLRELIQTGIGRYIARYGDKTQVHVCVPSGVDPRTGTRKIEKHFDLECEGGDRCRVTVYGSTGHIGSLRQNDAAITKWAYVVRELMEQRRSLGLAFTLGFQSAAPPAQLVFEGAQGFLPTHSMEEVKARTQAAFQRGMHRYLSDAGLPPDAVVCEVSFNKLHNDAYAGDPNSESMRRAARTAVDVGLARPDQPVRGWEVSCDARLFAHAHPGMPVITFGAGYLEHAHSERERIHIGELLDSICFTCLFVLRETGAQRVCPKFLAGR